MIINIDSIENIFFNETINNNEMSLLILKLNSKPSFFKKINLNSNEWKIASNEKKDGSTSEYHVFNKHYLLGYTFELKLLLNFLLNFNENFLKIYNINEFKDFEFDNKNDKF
jgi:hypothetical protein